MNGKLASKNFFWKWISRTEGGHDDFSIPNLFKSKNIEIMLNNVRDISKSKIISFQDASLANLLGKVPKMDTLFLFREKMAI